MYDRKQIEKNYCETMERIGRAATKSGRQPEEITLVTVSKTIPSEVVNWVIQAGARTLGESRGQELLEKYDQLQQPNDLRIHFIGHLQTNKVKQIVSLVDVIESVESERLVKEIDRQCQAIGKKMDIFIQVKVLHDPNKFGILPEELDAFLQKMGAYPNICVTGLMAIAPLWAGEAEKRDCFSQLRKLFIDTKDKKYDNVNMSFLSMGMSSDFETAIEEGANVVRVGTFIFGERK
jgi:pyridoxal phosphate enzyme (YggS family)